MSNKERMLFKNINLKSITKYDFDKDFYEEYDGECVCDNCGIEFDNNLIGMYKDVNDIFKVYKLCKMCFNFF